MKRFCLIFVFVITWCWSVSLSTATCQVKDAVHLVPSNAIAFVQSRSLGQSLARLASLVDDSGFQPVPFSANIYGFSSPQSQLSSYREEFCFVDEYWLASLIEDAVLSDSRTTTADRLRHLFPRYSFVALVPEQDRIVAVFGIEVNWGFDWFREFQAMASSRHSLTTFDHFGIQMYYSGSGEEADLFFFQHESMVYGAYSRPQAERLASMVADRAIDSKSLDEGRLYRRTVKPFAQLGNEPWDLEVFVAPDLLRRQSSKTIRSIFGQPAISWRVVNGEIVVNDALENLNFLDGGFGFGVAKKDSNLGVLIKLRFKDDTEAGICDFAVVRAVELPLSESDDFLDKPSVIDTRDIDWKMQFPKDTSSLWITRAKASERLLPIAGQLTPSQEANPSLMLAYHNLPFARDFLNGLKLDLSPIMVFSGGKPTVSYPWSFSGIVFPKQTNSKLTQFHDANAVTGELIEQPGEKAIKVKNLSAYEKLLYFEAFDSAWLVWQRTENGNVDAIVEMLQTNHSVSGPIQMEILRDMIHENSSVGWSIVEITSEAVPALHYFLPNLRESDIMIRPVPSMASHVRLPTTGEIVGVGDVFKHYRAANKHEFVGVAEDDFFADFWFRVRFQMCRYWQLRKSPELPTSSVTYLLHNTNQGNGIWLVKGRIAGGEAMQVNQ